MIRARVASALASALLPLTLAAPAAAESDVHRDAARDVTRVTYDAKTGEFKGARPDRAQTRADIVRFQTTYGSQLLKVAIRVREMGRRVPLWSGGFVRVETAGPDFLIRFSRGPGTRLAVDLGRANGRGDDCRGETGRVLLKRRSFTLAVPVDCLGEPAWVRTGARVGYELESALPSSWSDDARATGWQGEGPRPVLGPRLSRG